MDEPGQLIANLGVERLVFGTGIPFSDPDPALLTMVVLDATGEQMERIRWRNAARWGLDGR